MLAVPVRDDGQITLQRGRMLRMPDFSRAVPRPASPRSVSRA